MSTMVGGEPPWLQTLTARMCDADRAAVDDSFVATVEQVEPSRRERLVAMLLAAAGAGACDRRTLDTIVGVFTG